MKKQRRQFLQAFGITATVGLAGCSTQDRDSDSSSNQTNESAGVDSEDSEPEEEPKEQKDNTEEREEDELDESGTLEVKVQGENGEESIGVEGFLEGTQPIIFQKTSKN